MDNIIDKQSLQCLYLYNTSSYRIKYSIETRYKDDKSIEVSHNFCQGIEEEDGLTRYITMYTISSIFVMECPTHAMWSHGTIPVSFCMHM